ncbi:MAG: hypothetical protein ACE5D8_00740 [Fidelibacterota bacterium]
MELTLLHFLPICTTFLSLYFAARIYSRHRTKPGSYHLLWWSIGVALYGAGTFAESWITLFSWNLIIFKFWYITGAILGGAPLAQGTVWLLLRKSVAKPLSQFLIIYATIAAVFIILSPVDYALVNSHLPSGNVLRWQWVRLFSPLVNLYAVVFLIGGAAYSAWKFFRAAPTSRKVRDRFLGNVLIALGALLPGLGGIASRLGHTEYLYLGEIIGLIFVWIGYILNIRHRPVTVTSPGGISIKHPLNAIIRLLGLLWND